MSNTHFRFKQFTIHQDRTAMKVTTDSCLFGAWCASEISKLSSNKTLLDIGTGTGLLSLMVRQKNTIEIAAIEIEKNASRQAVENIKNSPWPEDIHVLNEDVSRFHFNRKFDTVISNPPFYENELPSPQLNRNIAHHSENLTMPELLRIIKEIMARGGTFFLLSPFKRSEEMEAVMRKLQLHIVQKITIKQTPVHAPFRTMFMGSVEPSTYNTKEMIIKDENEKYTPGFVSLLKDYYLYL